MSIDKNYLKKIKKVLHVSAGRRRDIIKESGDALHLAKRSIFALHRKNNSEAKQKLESSLTILKNLEKKYKLQSGFLNEGSYKAAVEEYVEAKLFMDFIEGKKISVIVGLEVDDNVYLAGLCDVPGELYRYAVKAATDKDFALVTLCAETANEIVGELIEFDLTSYLRTKFDQAKQATNKLEHIVYDLSLRQ